MTKPKVAFICVHNSCRSQIAEALGKALASDVFESYSAGTETKPRINQDAVRLVNELYGIDMEQTQYSKLISAIPEPDFTISMGCNVGCPFIGRPFDDNWGLEDPTGKDDAAFKDVIMQIHQNIIALKIAFKLYKSACQEGWHRPTLSLFAKVSELSSCALTKLACFHFLLTWIGFHGNPTQQEKLHCLMVDDHIPAGAKLY